MSLAFDVLRFEVQLLWIFVAQYLIAGIIAAFAGNESILDLIVTSVDGRFEQFSDLMFQAGA